MKQSSIGDSDTKRAKVRKSTRQQVVMAMQLQGMTQTAMAEQLGVERRTIARDVADLKPATEEVLSILERAQVKLREIYPVEKRVERIVTLAETARNDAVSLAAVQYSNELDGVVSERERMRIDRQTQTPQLQPMFSLPPGSEIHVSVGPQPVVDRTVSQVAIINTSAQVVDNKQ